MQKPDPVRLFVYLPARAFWSGDRVTLPVCALNVHAEPAVCCSDLSCEEVLSGLRVSFWGGDRMTLPVCTLYVHTEPAV